MMNPSLRNAYTDSPELHSNLLLGSLQLFLWLFFHPSAWCNHIARIDPALSPNFCLLGLKRIQWHNPKLHQLLILGYLIWPIPLSLLSIIVLWISGVNSILVGVGFGITFSLTSSIVLGTVLSVGTGLVSTIIGFLVISIIAGIATGLTTGLVVTPTDRLIAILIYGVPFSLFAGLLSSTTSRLSRSKFWN